MSAALAHHLIVPFASASSAGCQQAVQQLNLIHLPALLDRLQAEGWRAGDPLPPIPEADA